MSGLGVCLGLTARYRLYSRASLRPLTRAGWVRYQIRREDPQVVGARKVSNKRSRQHRLALSLPEPGAK